MAGAQRRGTTRADDRGSNARGERTRRRIAEATLSLLVESAAPPTAHDIATRAGVSHRLVFHHFEDLDALHLMVSGLYVERFGGLAPVVPADLPLETRIERTAGMRATLYESIGNLGRNAAALAPNHPGVAQGTAATHRILLRLLETTFEPELDGCGRTQRKEALAALDAASSWSLWDRLRRVDGLSVTSSRRIVSRFLRAALVGARAT